LHWSNWRGLLGTIVGGFGVTTERDDVASGRMDLRVDRVGNSFSGFATGGID
jgi:hypothetical protein